MKKYNIFEQEDPVDEPTPQEAPPEDPNLENNPEDPSEAPPEDNSNTYKLGRVYELKKIYSRLLALDNYLVSLNDTNLISLKKNIKQAIDLFEMLLLNVNEFEDKIDEIIITFYEFIKEVYEFIAKYFNDDKKKDETKNENLQEIGFSAALMAISLANMIWKNVADYRNKKYGQAANSCSGYSGKNKEICKQEYYIKTLKTSIQMLKSQLSKCNKSDKPDLCKNKIQSYINSYNNQIQNKNEKIKMLR